MKALALFRNTVAALLLAPACFAQQPSSDEQSCALKLGDQTAAIGFGLGIRYGYVPNTAVAPAWMAMYERGIASGVGEGTVGVGGSIAFKSADYQPIPLYAGPAYQIQWSNFLAAIRVSHHFALKAGFEKLDLYAGGMAGARAQRYRRSTATSVVAPPIVPEKELEYLRPIVGVFAGCRYLFMPRLGAWLEVGYDVSLVKAGAHVSF